MRMPRQISPIFAYVMETPDIADAAASSTTSSSDASYDPARVVEVTKAVIQTALGFASSDASVRSFMISAHTRNEGVLFKNGSNEFKIMLRPSFDESDDPQEETQFQVCIIADPNDGEDIREAVEMEFEGVYDEEDDSVVIVHEIPVAKISDLKTDSHEVGEVRKRVNEIYEWRICSCGKRFVKRPEDAVCLLCDLTASDRERAALADESRACAICLDNCGNRHAKRMKCCSAFVHDRCSRKWLSGHGNCPHCRAPVENRIEQIIDLL